MRRRTRWSCWSCELEQPRGSFQCERCYACYACCLANGCIDPETAGVGRGLPEGWRASRVTIMRACGCRALEVLTRSGAWFTVYVNTCALCIPVPGSIGGRWAEDSTLDLFPDPF